MDRRKTIRELLENRARQTPDFVFGIHEDQEITVRVLESRVNRLANGFIHLGIEPGQRVAVMFGNHVDHIITFLALAKIGAVWVPVNIHLRGPSLAFVLERATPAAVVVDANHWNQLKPVIGDTYRGPIIVRGFDIASTDAKASDYAGVVSNDSRPPPTSPKIDEIRAIFFTSGTTGPPKGALLTEKMLTTCAAAAGMAADARRGDVFLLWEPIHHTSGAQMCVLALMKSVRLAIVSGFSASRFWDQIRKYGVTKLHYLGGILDILLKQPARPYDQDHSVRIAFGAGCTKTTWRTFEQRFGIKVREVYGMTEASCFTTLNLTGKIGAIGKPYPHFEVQIADDTGKPLPAGRIGEIIVREKEPGLIVQEYLEDSASNSTYFRNGWLFTGDLGYYDDAGDYYFTGRKKDSIRRRGENISAWEVERVLNSHPDVQESAVIGVDAEIGEQELKAFIKCKPGASVDPLDIIKWCKLRMPYYHLPRYLAFVSAFEKTPTERIRKENLSRDTSDCWDLERSENESRR